MNLGMNNRKPDLRVLIPPGAKNNMPSIVSNPSTPLFLSWFVLSYTFFCFAFYLPIPFLVCCCLLPSMSSVRFSSLSYQTWVDEVMFCDNFRYMTFLLFSHVPWQLLQQTPESDTMSDIFPLLCLLALIGPDISFSWLSNKVSCSSFFILVLFPLAQSYSSPIP